MTDPDPFDLAPCLGLLCVRRESCARYCPEGRSADLIQGGLDLWLGHPNAGKPQCPGYVASTAPPNSPQPPPVPNSGPAIWDLVIADMQVRDQIGADRYGTRLQPFNGRDGLRDAYEEILDLVCYLRQAIYERDHGT